VIRVASRVMAALMVVLGAAMVVTALVRGGGPLAYGVIIGVLFVAAGALRLRVEGRR
jgi:hypothetical protein